MLESLSKFKTKKICVIGDFMLDSYTKGSVKRISPEAPVCVLKVTKQERLPGGAGNVALNLKNLGADVYTIGRIGDDFASSYLKSDLEKAGICTKGLIFEEDFETPLKNRFMAQYQQLLRVDFEKDQPLKDETCLKALSFLNDNLKELDLILISDYNKGFLSRSFLKSIIELARSEDIPVFVDPKGHDFTKYHGATLIKPNLSEAYLAAGYDEKQELGDVAKKLFRDSEAKYLLITRSEKGMSFFDENERYDVKARAKEVIDVTGAGDTVISTLALTYASGIDIKTCIEWSNIAASCAIEKLGCVHVGKKELVKALSHSDTRYKYLPNLSDDLSMLLIQDQKIKAFYFDERTLDFKLLSEISNFKSENKDTLIAAIITSEFHDDMVKSLCDLATIDLVVPHLCENVMRVIQDQETILV